MLEDSLFNLGSYDYVLPEHLIAQKPAEPRDSARLLVVNRSTGTWEHSRFSELPRFLDEEDLIVANNTKVLRARMLGVRLREDASGRQTEGGQVEFVLLECLGARIWEGLFRASARSIPGLRFRFPTRDGKGLQGVILRGASESPSGTVVAEFDRDPVDAGAGELPLPHYILRDSSGDLQQSWQSEQDETNYQTVFAKHLGSAAAPTAGLHFTDRVLEGIRNKGVCWSEVTLHVGLGTFRPVKVNDIRKHPMHEERYEISSETASRVTEWKQKGKRVLAVGTTSVRTLESAWKGNLSEQGGFLQPGIGRTSLFICPGGYPFKVVDRLLTNFHLPKSTLLMLVSAFAGRDLAMAVYQEAVQEQYRFFSYGDSMLIL